MKICVPKISRALYDAFSGSGCGTVHSVYRRTVNLLFSPASDAAGQEFASFLMALQDHDCVLSPLSLCTTLSADALFALPIRAGQPAAFESHRLRIETPAGTVMFLCENAGIVDLHLASHPALPLSNRQIAALHNELFAALSAAPSESFAGIFTSAHAGSDAMNAGFAAVCDDPVRMTAAARMDAVRTLLHAGDPSAAAEELCRLIGLGIGLTPSGDDFLCGVLAGLTLRCGTRAVGPSPNTRGRGASAHLCGSGSTLTGFSSALRACVLSHIPDTNEISGAFLRCAAQGQFSEPVCSLASLPDAAAVRTSFARIGHSSGFDTLAGVYYALTLPEAES